MEIEVETTIDRPVADVWRWYAVEHVRNHPRWDPDMELEQLSDGPMGLGTRIRRRNVRWGTPVEGEMEVVGWEPERAFALRIHDANMEMHGRAMFEADGPDRTRLRVVTDIPGLEGSKAEFLSSMMERSVGNVKSLLESDV
ncbi:MAG TPA: SRPBCC family protein [Actinomycetota bacterium]|nr:SRPBCC family protein [Actinomycetota bacterium]